MVFCRGDHGWFFHEFPLKSRLQNVVTMGDFFMYFPCILGSMMWRPWAKQTFSFIFTVFLVPWRGDHGQFFMYFHYLFRFSVQWHDDRGWFFLVFSLFIIISSKWMDEKLWEQDKDLNRTPWQSTRRGSCQTRQESPWSISFIHR